MVLHQHACRAGFLAGFPLLVYAAVVLYHWATLNKGTESSLPLFDLLETTQLPMLNGLATLLLSFYANLAMEQYRSVYHTCQSAKQRLIELIILSAAIFGDEVAQGESVLIDIWRSANLVHAAAYALADK